MLQGLIIAALFFVLAYVVRNIVIRTLSSLASRSSATFDDQIVSHLRRPLFTTIFFFGLILAIKAANLESGADLVVNVLLSLIVVNWITALMNISSIVLKALGGQDSTFRVVDERTIPILDLIIKLLVLSLIHI